MCSQAATQETPSGQFFVVWMITLIAHFHWHVKDSTVIPWLHFNPQRSFVIFHMNQVVKRVDLAFVIGLQLCDSAWSHAAYWVNARPCLQSAWQNSCVAALLECTWGCCLGIILSWVPVRVWIEWELQPNTSELILKLDFSKVPQTGSCSVVLDVWCSPMQGVFFLLGGEIMQVG